MTQTWGSSTVRGEDRACTQTEGKGAGGGSSRLLEYMCGRSETSDYSGLRISEYIVQPIA